MNEPRTTSEQHEQTLLINDLRSKRGQTTPERRERGRNHADAVELGGLGGHSTNPTYPVPPRLQSRSPQFSLH